jgi:nucleotide-binding universal stress UspA family protein
MRILITANGSSNTEAALYLGAQIARRAGKPPTILIVIKSQAARSRPRDEAILARARELLQPEITDMQARVRIGHPAQEIVREAREGSYHLVVVGERHKDNLAARLEWGSTAIQVVEHAPCTVLVARGPGRRVQRILLCDSGPPGASVLTRFLAQGEWLTGEEEMTILHVMSQMSAGPGVEGKELRASARELIGAHAPEGQLLERDIRMLAQRGIQARAEVRHGLVVDEL